MAGYRDESWSTVSQEWMTRQEAAPRDQSWREEVAEARKMVGRLADGRTGEAAEAQRMKGAAEEQMTEAAVAAKRQAVVGVMRVD